MQSIAELIENVPAARIYGRVASVQGLLVEVADSPGALSVGARVAIASQAGREVLCEVVGFRDGRALCLPYARLEGVRMGQKAYVDSDAAQVHPARAWLGRVINAFGEPIDGKGALVRGPEPYPLRAAPPPAHQRQRVTGKLDLGVNVINAFATCCRGQRLGLFSGSGVGKSILLSMLARYTASDVIVIGLIGERGREVQEFLADDLGPDGLKRSVVVVATSDEAALMRRQAAHLTMTIAEYFRDQGLQVLCLIDSVTRFAMAQREIGLSCGEPPASKGYTPTVFAELPRLLERAGPGTKNQGAITGLFTVLVEGDDHNEPIADACRGILDGHIVLERQIAERGRYPAVNVLKSVSRTMPGCNSEKEQALVNEAKRHLAIYEDMAELIRLGAYRPGTDRAVDDAIRLYPELESFMRQGKGERATLEDAYQGLERILKGDGAGRTKP